MNGCYSRSVEVGELREWRREFKWDRVRVNKREKKWDNAILWWIVNVKDSRFHHERALARGLLERITKAITSLQPSARNFYIHPHTHRHILIYIILYVYRFGFLVAWNVVDAVNGIEINRSQNKWLRALKHKHQSFNF